MPRPKSKQKREKLTNDQALYQWGAQIQKKADRLLAEGRINRVDYRDASWVALQAMRPRDCVKVIGL